MGDNFPLQKGPLGVEGTEVFLFDSIHSGTLGTPASCEYSRSLDNPIRGNAVHPDALVSELDGEQPVGECARKMSRMLSCKCSKHLATSQFVTSSCSRPIKKSEVLAKGTAGILITFGVPAR